MTAKVGRILAVDDNEDILFALKLLLKNHVESITAINNPERIPEVMKKEDFKKYEVVFFLILLVVIFTILKSKYVF